MIGRGRALVVAGTSVAAAIWLNLHGVAAQVPTIPAPPDTTAPPTTVAPPAEAPAPASPDTLPAGTPEAPPTPAGPAPTPGTTTTTVPVDKSGGAGLPPSRAVGGSASASFGLDLSEIDDLRRAARGKGPRAPEADAGFDLTLGFRAAAGIEGSGEEALELGAEEEEIATVRSASAVAAGLMALLLTGIARGLLRQGRPARPGPAGD